MTIELGSWSRLATGCVVAVMIASVGAACSSNKKNDPVDDTSGSGGTKDGSGGSGGSGGDTSSSTNKSSSSSSSGGGGGSGGDATSSGGSSGSGGSGASGGSGGSGGTTGDDCSSDDDCDGDFCDPLAKLCVECFYDSDCGTAERCLQQKCDPIIQCGNSLDCPEDEVCDSDRGRCTACVADADCGDAAACENETCVAFDPCNNSLDCNSNQVCDTVNDRCVRCVSDADCSEDTVCIGNSCRITCQSDNQCTGLGLLCDSSQGYCARCISDDDCPDEYHCDTGQCKVDVCEPGTAYCVDNVIHECDATGSGHTQTSCGSGRSCQQKSENEASCEDWVCSPGVTECDLSYENIIECSDDGLEIVDSTSCGDQICYEGACEDLVCPPSTYICVDNDRHYCYSDGQSSYLVESCDQSNEYCNPATAMCEPLLCQPDQPACDGTVATTCNSTGDGYESGGTDCDDSDQVCVGGSCADCNNTVLFLSDTDTTGNAIWVADLEAAGMVVTEVDGGVTTYSGSPDASTFGAIVLHTALDYTGMPTQGQTAIVDAQAEGTGIFINEWASYAVYNGYWTDLADLTLLSYSSYTTGYPTFTLTDTGHPIWAGLPTSWTSSVNMYVTWTQLVNGGVSIATCDYCGSTSSYSGSAVAVRNTTGGRIAHVAHWGNYSDVYNDANLVTLNTNATQWVAACE